MVPQGSNIESSKAYVGQLHVSMAKEGVLLRLQEIAFYTSESNVWDVCTSKQMKMAVLFTQGRSTAIETAGKGTVAYQFEDKSKAEGCQRHQGHEDRE